MKTAIIFLFIGILILAFVYLNADVKMVGQTAEIDVFNIHLGLSYNFVMGFGAVFLGILFSIGGLIGTGFRGIFYWILLLLLCGAAAYFLFYL